MMKIMQSKLIKRIITIMITIMKIKKITVIIKITITITVITTYTCRMNCVVNIAFQYVWSCRNKELENGINQGNTCICCSRSWANQTVSKTAISHEAGGPLQHGWLNADTRPYSFFYKESNTFIISSPHATPPPPPPPTNTRDRFLFLALVMDNFNYWTQ